MKFYNNDHEKRKTELVIYNGQLIATFDKGECEVVEPDKIQALKALGFNHDETADEIEEPKKKKRNA